MLKISFCCQISDQFAKKNIFLDLLSNYGTICLSMVRSFATFKHAKLKVFQRSEFSKPISGSKIILCLEKFMHFFMSLNLFLRIDLILAGRWHYHLCSRTSDGVVSCSTLSAKNANKTLISCSVGYSECPLRFTSQKRIYFVIQ